MYVLVVICGLVACYFMNKQIDGYISVCYLKRGFGWIKYVHLFAIGINIKEVSMNRKIALFFACCAVSCLAACNESAHMERGCEEGEHSCDGNKVMLCTDGELTVETVCDNGLMCDPRSFQCADVFQIQCSKEDERRCLQNYLLVCQDGEWKVLEACGAAQTCNAVTSTCDGGDVTLDCDEDGARKCDNNRVMVCTDGKWTVEKTCEENETCNDGTFACDPTEPEPCDEEGVLAIVNTFVKSSTGS